MNDMTLSLTPLRPALLAGFDNDTHVLVRLTAPALPAELKRSVPLHVALVLDRSGSMSGQPLDEAKRCAEFVVAGLNPEDRASLVTFESTVQTLVAANPVGDGQALRQAIKRIDCGGSTDLHGGWFAGAETLAPLAAGKTLSRVILLSDGCANHGLTAADAIAAQCRELAEAGVTTSTYGLGRDFNETLMQAMARAGGGNAYYGETASDLMDPFREELALINALVARRLQLHIKAPAGVKVEVLNAYERGATGGYKLPDLAYGADAWALLRVRTSRAIADGAQAAPVPLLEASVHGELLDGTPLQVAPANLEMSAVGSVAYEALASDEVVARRVEELETARETDNAREAAMQQDWATVDRLLKKLRGKVAHSPWLKSVVQELEQLASHRDAALFAKEAAYGTHRMRSRLAASFEQADIAAPVAEFLRRKTAQGKAQPPSE